ncbi:MAG: DNA gyrase subunit A [Dehalococcoidia bacterium]|nr:DNA gyrase subunit A [Dehalococcoidia bacterium]
MDIGTVRLVNIEDEMRGSYLDYAMSVIVSRALPDVRDGLKPVHRRILYAMEELGFRQNSPYKKCARIVGEVLGKFHPHGDSSVYDALVRLAQDFSMRYPLIDGQGNFGSVDNDPAAAMRYTEARMAAITEQVLADIEKNTVDFVDNFDGSLKEPSVLPSKLPNLLVNGSSGIAVGMATNIPPHNLTEVCDGIAHLIDNPDATVEDLCRFVKGPDFPTAGIILGSDGIKNAYATGRGRIVVRARSFIEEMPKGGRFQIVVDELPYQINKATLIERIADLVKDRKLEGISEIRDESDREGMRIVFELRRDAQPNQVLNNLFKQTSMQAAFSVNMLALVDGQPRVLTLKMALQQYIIFRREVITRRTEFDLNKAKERAHILEGLKIALDHLDAVIATIRQSPSADVAKTNLIGGFSLTEVQAQAILEMQLRRLAALERQKILDEYAELLKTIAQLEDLLADPNKILLVAKNELVELKEKYGDARRTRIMADETGEFTDEDLIPDQEVIITMSQKGYIKRLPMDTYRSQRRGGRGIAGMGTRETDAVYKILVANTHDSLLFFSNRGKVYQLKSYEVPDTSRQAKGTPVINLLTIEQDEYITGIVVVPNFMEGEHFVMVTRRGEVKRVALSEFSSVRPSGLIAMDLEEGDEMAWVHLTDGKQDIVIATAEGKAIRFAESEVRVSGRASGGIRGIRLESGDVVTGMDVVEPDGELFLVTAFGFGKRTPISEFPRQGRAGGGVRALNVSDRTGPLVAARFTCADDDVMLISKEGIVIRTPVGMVSKQGRASQGVTVMRLDKGDSVASLTVFNGKSKEQELDIASDGGQEDAGPRPQESPD